MHANSQRARLTSFGMSTAGVGNIVGNKGGVAVSATYRQNTRLLFVTSHFAAHDHKVQQRRADYLRISAGLFSSRDDAGNSIWIGTRRSRQAWKAYNHHHFEHATITALNGVCVGTT